MKTVIIADHHRVLREALVPLIAQRKTLRVHALASDMDRFARELRQQPVDALVLDINLPPSGGLEAARRALRMQPDLGIVAVGLSAHGPYPGRFLEAGVRGLVSQRSSVDELLAALEKVAAGGSFLAPEIAENLVFAGLGGSRNPVDTLSSRELAVMVMVSQGRRLNEISDRLCISPKTVSTYRSRLCRKLGVSTDVELTHFCLEHGLIEAGYCA
jgi:two-component system invasion response regulator UvrY